MNTAFPPNDISHVIEADRANVWHHLIQHKPFETGEPRIIVEGKGMRVWDAHGKEYIDAVSGAVWTVNTGYGRTRIADAVREQLVKMCYFAQAAGSIPGALYAEKLIEKMPGMSRVYYTNSGSEANEKAFKMVRQIAHKKYGGRKTKILYRDRDYHGSTLAAMSAGGQDERNMQYGPFAPDFVRVPHCMEYRKEELGLGHLSGRDFGIAAANQIEEVILREGSRHGRRALPRTRHGGRRRHPTRPKATGSGCRKSAANTTSFCISTRSSAASGAPAPTGSATSITA